MSFPNIPNVTPSIDINREDVINLLLASIAFEELGLAHIINAEAEKIQAVVGTLPESSIANPSISDLISINQSVDRTLKTVIKKEMLLEFKVEEIKNLIPPPCRTIRVSGFSFPRNRAPLIEPNGTPSQDDFGSSNIVNALLDPNNFSCERGIVRCNIQLLPFVNTIATGSLVDAQGNRKVDVFFAGLTNTALTNTEANELAAFVNAGGVLYISGNTSGNEGPSYNPLFTALGVTDTFSAQVIFTGNNVLTSNPLPTPVTTGPFGTIGPLEHTPFRVFLPGTGLTGVATGFNSQNFILSEGAIGAGYVVETGDPLYFNMFTGSNANNLNYFLNLFALACGR